MHFVSDIRIRGVPPDQRRRTDMRLGMAPLGRQDEIAEPRHHDRYL
jgi:hypothetical protein